MKVKDSHKIKIRKLHQKGFTSNEIIAKLNLPYTRQQVAAIKAWKTMQN